MAPRLALILAASGAAALLPTATADAARTERFVAFFRLEQRTTWEEPTLDGPAGRCDTVYKERHGSETSILRTTPMRVRVTRLPGGRAAMAYGAAHRPQAGLAASGRASRRYVHRSHLTHGPCTPSPGKVIGREDDVDRSCGGDFRSHVQFASIARVFRPVIQDWNTLALLELQDCQMVFPRGAEERATGIPIRLPARRLFGDEEYVILRARDALEETRPDGTRSTTHVSWTLRLRRAR